MSQSLRESWEPKNVTYLKDLTKDDWEELRGLTKAEASEVLTHLAFYAGWPNVMSAVPVVKGVF